MRMMEELVEAAEAQQEVGESRFDDHVQGGWWLVGDDDVGVHDEGEPDHDPLAHAPESWCGYSFSLFFSMPRVSSIFSTAARAFSLGKPGSWKCIVSRSAALS